MTAIDPSTGLTIPVEITLNNVTSSGSIIISVSTSPISGSTNISGEGVSQLGIYINITSTVTTSSASVVKLAYTSADVTAAGGSASQVRLFHHDGSSWVDITTGRDGTYVWGTVSSFSPFTIGLDTTAPAAPDAGNITIARTGSASNDTIAGLAGAVENLSTVRIWDSDPTGDATLLGSKVSGPDGSFAAVAIGNDRPSVYVTATDRAGNLSTATNVAANTPPTAVGQSLTTNEDTPLVILLSGTDPDGDTLTSSIFANPDSATGSLSVNENGSYTFTPVANWFGTTLFTFRVADSGSPSYNSDTATIGITVTAVNDLPTAGADSYSVAEDTLLTVNAAAGVLDNDSDPVENSSLTAVLATNVSNGTLALSSDGSFTYTPNLNIDTSDSFTYYANDGTDNSTAATVTITINAVNDAPTVVADSVTVNEDSSATTIDVLANDSDIEGTTLQITAVTNGTGGTVTIVDGTPDKVTYTPSTNYDVTDTFTYTASDGTDTTIGTVTVNITPSQDSPVAVADTPSTSEDGTVTFNVLTNDSDPDTGDSISVSASDSSGTTGSVTNNGSGSFTYNPNAQFESLAVGESTTDTFTYTIVDTNSANATATVTVTINGANDAVVANADSGSVTEDGDAGSPTTSVDINVFSNDTDVDTNDSQTVSAISTSGTTGTVSDQGSGVLRFSPNGQHESLAVGESTTTTFTYTVSDGNATSTATVTVTINGENDAPVTVADTGATNDNSFVTVDAGANDTDADTSDSLTVTAIANSGSFGATVIVSAGKVKYTAATNTSGDDTVTYTVSDGNGGTANGTLVVTVTDVTNPDNPTYASVQENSPGTDDKIIGTSTDDETVTIQVWDDAGQNNVLIGSQSVAPSGSINIAIGDDQYAEVWIIAIDARGNVNQTAQKLSNTFAQGGGSGDLWVVWLPPLVNEDLVAQTGRTIPLKFVLKNASGVENSQITVGVSIIEDNGTVIWVDQSIRYSNGNSSYSLGIKTKQGQTSWPTGVYTVTLTSPDANLLNNNNVYKITIVDSSNVKGNRITNLAPTATAQSVSTTTDTAVTITLTAIDLDGDTLTYTVVDGPTNGTLDTASGSTIVYTPGSSYTGEDTFTFKVNDGTIDSTTVTVTITVSAPA